MLKDTRKYHGTFQLFKLNKLFMHVWHFTIQLKSCIHLKIYCPSIRTEETAIYDLAHGRQSPGINSRMPRILRIRDRHKQFRFPFRFRFSFRGPT